MKILDTNFIISLFNHTDRNHEKAKDVFFSLDENEKVRVPFIVAAELAVSDDAKKLLDASKAISSKFLVNNESDIDYIITISERTRKKLKTNDCLLISLCRRHNAELITFDKALKNQL